MIFLSAFILPPTDNIFASHHFLFCLRHHFGGHSLFQRTLVSYVEKFPWAMEERKFLCSMTLCSREVAEATSVWPRLWKPCFSTRCQSCVLFAWVIVLFILNQFSFYRPCQLWSHLLKSLDSSKTNDSTYSDHGAPLGFNCAILRVGDVR
jgi:hypothetical protein